MEQIRLGLRYNRDISQYADPKLSAKRMEQIRIGLHNRLDISMYDSNKFNPD